MKRESAYAALTRGWWWRGAVIGFFAGMVAGLLFIAVLAWITGNL